MPPSSLCPCWLGLGLLSPVTDGVHFNHLTEAVSAGFSTAKLLVFLPTYLPTYSWFPVLFSGLQPTVASRSPVKLAFPFFFFCCILLTL